MASSERGRALGRYVLQKPIATGTTATIWRGYDTRTGRQVAVKSFHPHLFADATGRRRMKIEAKSARRVRGRTVVSAIDTISTRDEFALVFPFVPGKPLIDRLREGTPLTAEDTARIAVDVADALVVIHGAGLVHRDVKPGNVLLADDGRAVLLDFGISRSVADDIETDQQLTGAGLAIGTLPYMAPEQLAAREATAATDAYALGVLLYEMLAGHRPYEASSPVGLATEQRLPPARIDGAPQPLMDLTLRALAVEPSSRPTALHMSVALRSWLNSPAAIDAPTALVTAAVVATPRRRNTMWATLALGLIGALVVVIVALAATPPTDQSPSQTAAPVAVAPTSTTTPRPKPTTPPVAPAAVPTPTPQPSATTAPTPPSTVNPKPPPTKPKHGADHHHHGHHGHRPKHHHHH